MKNESKQVINCAWNSLVSLPETWFRGAAIVDNREREWERGREGERERDMDEELGEFVREPYMNEDIDMDYEFDAPRFYDFTQPETDWEATEAEGWFQYARSYPPSPFIVKLLNWYKGNLPGHEKTYAESKVVKSIRSVSSGSSNCMEAVVYPVEEDNRGGLILTNRVAQNSPKAKKKSSVKPRLSRSSTLMKPTASHLAKQNQRREVHSNRTLRRFEKKPVKFDENSQSSPLFDSVATKRQKLEAGYLRKVSQLKHQPLWLHKVPEKVGADVARPKVTVPREPNLETAHRAQRRRYKIHAKSGEQAKIFKASPLPKTSTLQRTEFQVFHLRTPEKSMQHTFKFNNDTNTPNYSCLSQKETTGIKGPNSVYALKQEKSEMAYKCTACSLKNKKLSSKREIGVFQNIKEASRVPRDIKLSSDRRFQKEPPTDLFSQMSLACEAQHDAKPQSKSVSAC